MISIWGVIALALALGGCGSKPFKQAAGTSQGGGYYLDDGPEANPPPNLDAIPDAVPRVEPLHRFANRTYAALGNTYTPQLDRPAYREEGMASWYGRRFHGKKTASGEPYDMYAMTAAHPTLPIPSYARVTALNNGKSVVVRINDRGPFHSNRIIDLSYTAAYKLGYIAQGSTRVRVESLDAAVSDTQNLAQTQTQTQTQMGGVYLQVGAFSNADNARELRERLMRELQFEDGQAHVVMNGDLHRVQLGPYSSDDAAHMDRERMRERLALNAILVRRD